MSFFVHTLNDKIHHGLEKALMNIEELHQQAAAKPFDLLDKSEKLQTITHPLRTMTHAVISKTYRGVRDFNEMSHQVNERYLSMTGWKH